MVPLKSAGVDLVGVGAISICLKSYFFKFRTNGGLLDIGPYIKVTHRLMLLRLTKFHISPFPFFNAKRILLCRYFGRLIITLYIPFVFCAVLNRAQQFGAWFLGK